YCDLLDTIAAFDLVNHVAPIQLAIRLLITEGSRLLSTLAGPRPRSGVDEMRLHVGAFDPQTMTYRWSHPDPRVDDLHREISTLVGSQLAADRRATFDAVSALARDRAGLPASDSKPARDRATVPYLDEPWYC